MQVENFVWTARYVRGTERSKDDAVESV